MSEKQNRGIGDMSKYDAMTTEELEEILRLDAQTPEEQKSDTEKIFYIMEVLVERKRNNGHTGKTAQEAYASFRQNYMPETDNVEIENSPKNNKTIKMERKRLHWLRVVSTTAAVLAIIILGSITTKAFGVSIWEAVVKWTQETFNFGEWGNAAPNNNRSYSSLQEALEQGGVTAPLAPTWIPADYELFDITVEITPFKRIYKAQYISGEKDLAIIVRDHLDNDPAYVEQSDGSVEEYEVSGITYYLFENNKQVQAVWIMDSYECYISGNVTIDELKMMINSIEKG